MSDRNERACAKCGSLLHYTEHCAQSQDRFAEAVLRTQDQEEWQRLRPLTPEGLPAPGRIVAVVYAVEGAPPTISTGACLARYLALYGSEPTFRWRYATEAEATEYEEELTRWGATLISTVGLLVQRAQKP